MNMPFLKSVPVLFASIIILFSSCQEPLTGLPSGDEKVDLCRQTIQNEYTLELPCEWAIEDIHPEQQSIGTIHTPDQRIHFQKNTFNSLDEIVDDVHQTYFYPAIGGRFVFKEIERGGEILVYAYYESLEVEGLSKRLTFWYVKKDNHEMIMDRILSITPIA